MRGFFVVLKILLFHHNRDRTLDLDRLSITITSKSTITIFTGFDVHGFAVRVAGFQPAPQLNAAVEFAPFKTTILNR
jgi:hypothetical protein